VRGSACGLSWNSGMKLDKQSTDTWSVDVNCDGDVQDLQAKILIGDQQWSLGANTVCDLSDGQDCELFPWFFNSNGRYEVIEQKFYSSSFHNYRNVIMYLPPSYDENQYKYYPTLLMHDGQNLFNDSTSFAGVSWHCDVTATSLIMQETIEEFVILGVYNTDQRMNEYTYSYDKSQKTGGDGDLYLDFLEETIIPKVSQLYRMKTDQENMAMTGSSLGGLISCYAGFTRSTIYSKVGCMSSSFWWDNDDFNNTIMLKPSPLGKLAVYLDSGDSGKATCDAKEDGDDCVETIKVRDHFSSLGWTLNTDLFYYLDAGGQHNEYYWGNRFNRPLQAFFGTN